jgi:hypothetical protein
MSTAIDFTTRRNILMTGYLVIEKFSFSQHFFVVVVISRRNTFDNCIVGVKRIDITAKESSIDH